MNQSQSNESCRSAETFAVRRMRSDDRILLHNPFYPKKVSPIFIFANGPPQFTFPCRTRRTRHCGSEIKRGDSLAAKHRGASAGGLRRIRSGSTEAMWDAQRDRSNRKPAGGARALAIAPGRLWYPAVRHIRDTCSPKERRGDSSLPSCAAWARAMR